LRIIKRSKKQIRQIGGGLDEDQVVSSFWLKFHDFRAAKKYCYKDKIRVLIFVYFDINSLQKVNYSEILEREETTILSARKTLLYKRYQSDEKSINGMKISDKKSRE